METLIKITRFKENKLKKNIPMPEKSIKIKNPQVANSAGGE